MRRHEEKRQMLSVLKFVKKGRVAVGVGWVEMCMQEHLVALP